mgnify:CR=1 FL=1
MKVIELRSKMKEYMQDAMVGSFIESAKVSILDKMMEDIEAYTEQKMLDSNKTRISENCSDIQNGPYWERRKQL